MKLVEKADRITSLYGRANLFFTRLIRYSIVGILSFSIDLLLLYLITDKIGFFYLGSATISFILATTFNYILNRKWGYRETKRSNTFAYSSFFLVNLTGLIIVLSLLALFVEVFQFHYILSRIFAGLIAGLIDFLLNTIITFHVPLTNGKRKN